MGTRRLASLLPFAILISCALLLGAVIVQAAPLPATMGADGDANEARPGLASAAAGPLTYTVYLPLVLAPPPPSAPPVPNGDFEAGHSAWLEYSSSGYPVIVSTADVPSLVPHSGSWLAWLGGANDDISYIQQQLTVPPSFPYLSYWHWIGSEDLCGYDFAGVLVNGTVVDVYTLCSSTNTGSWVKHVVYLGAYAGQSVSVQIRVETDPVLLSALLVDDVAFQATASTAGEVPAAGTASGGMPAPQSVLRKSEVGSPEGAVGAREDWVLRRPEDRR